MNVMRGKYPVSSNIGAADNWYGKAPDGSPGTIPKPDVNLNWLRGMSLFGLDHIYARSPGTGIFKFLLTVGMFVSILVASTTTSTVAALSMIPAVLLLGAWWLWDILQLFTEGERVVTYGMTMPFDVMTGIAQGMITDKPSYYKSRSPFSMWILAALFGFLGADALLLQKWGQFIRRLFDTSYLSGAIASAVTATGTFGKFVAGTTAAVLTFWVVVPWLYALGTIFNPDALLSKGLSYDMFADFLNYFDTWTKDIGPRSLKGVRADFGYENITPAEFAKRFEVRHVGQEDDPRGEANSTWLSSIAAGSLYTAMPGLFVDWITGFFGLPPPFRNFIAGTYGDEKKAPDYMKLATSAMNVVAPGTGKLVSSIADQATAGLAQLDALKTQASAGVGAITAAAANPLGAVQQQLADKGSSVIGDALKASGGLPMMRGGAHQGNGAREELSTEAKILGAVIVALTVGGGMKATVDWMMADQ